MKHRWVFSGSSLITVATDFKGVRPHNKAPQTYAVFEDGHVDKVKEE